MGKPAAKLQRIVSTLRTQIVGGEFPPAHRLPTRIELEKAFRVSSVTIQRALDILVAEGFVEARGRKGTFVVDHPPHLSRYLVAFDGAPDAAGRWSALYISIRNEVQRVNRERHRHLTLFHGVKSPTDIPAYNEICEMIAGHKIAGIFFANAPFPFAGTPLMDEPGIPRVAFMSTRAHAHVTPATVCDSAMLHKTAAYFRDRGRKRVGILMTPGFGDKTGDLIRHFTDYGLDLRPEWLQAATFQHPSWARHIMHLMMSPANGERPDALFIRDDNLLPDASRGLLDAGALPGEDLEVLSLCNFPWATESAVPVRRIGYDLGEMLNRSLAVIDAERRGLPPPASVEIPIIFDHETKFQIIR